MSQANKFIITRSETVANKMIGHGFVLVSNTNGTYTFINQPPQHFKFDEIDVKKVVYTNILSI